MKIAVKTTIVEDVRGIAVIAKDAFALACPSSADLGEIEKYISYNLNTEYFENIIANKATYIAYAFVNARNGRVYSVCI
jgi:hypothetical protein